MCCVSGMWTGQANWMQLERRVQVDPAHLKTRATGGDDLYNVIPLSRTAHELQHRIGWPAFERKYGIDAQQIATDLTETWLATNEGIRWRDAHPTNEDV